MATFNFPDSPTLNQTYTFAGVTWKWNGSVWKKQSELGATGQKGEKGNKGDKGEKGQKGQKGIDGAFAGKGQKGQKGERGDVEQAGNKGQKGTTGTSVKGQKGATGTSVKGSKGAPGTNTSNTFLTLTDTPSSYSGQTGKTVKVNSSGNGLEFTDLGSGVTGTIPSGGIILWSGASNKIGQPVASGGTGTGWVLCDGSNGTPNLTNRFVIGAGSSYNVDDKGGSADATLVSHSHTTDSIIEMNNTNGKSLTGAIVKISEGFNREGTATGVFTKTNDGNNTVTGSLSTSPVSGVTMDANHRHGMTSAGTSGTNANLPPYYALCYIMKT
tara:strand:- start:826 stop:1806 length:981 start_codon:yes stop_codon:yes gene_type:complete